MRKVFGIGLTRTGLTSLAAALRSSGYDVIHYPEPFILFGGGYDCVLDLPVVIHYKRLDSRFPGSKFIYTTRDKDGWLKSMELYYSIVDGENKERKVGASQHENRVTVYGRFSFDWDAMSAAYDRHRCDVLAYFATRPKDLLELDICNGDGWDELCPFLGIDVPATAFPYKHKQIY